MSDSSIGKLFKVTTFGESHGKGIGCIVDGCPPNLALTEADLQPDLDRRKPGQSKFTTQRREPDEVQIFSGVFEGKTTGAGSRGLGCFSGLECKTTDTGNQGLFRFPGTKGGNEK